MDPRVLEKRPHPRPLPPALVKRWGLVLWMVLAATALLLARSDGMQVCILFLRDYLGEIILVTLGVLGIAGFTWIVDG